MPGDPTARQSEHASAGWFSSAALSGLLQAEQRQAAPELARSYGHYGLYLRPSAAAPRQLSGNLMHSMLGLHRGREGLAGDLACADAAIPLASDSLALVYCQHVLETSPDPVALVAEIGRVLRPEGRALLLVFNPLGVFRLRWWRRGLHAFPSRVLGQMAMAAGMEVQCVRPTGVLWRAHGALGEHADGPLSGVYSSYLMVARRREPGLTPQASRPRRVALNPGMNPG